MRALGGARPVAHSCRFRAASGMIRVVGVANPLSQVSRKRSTGEESPACV
jgi:hypothetical protein